MREHTSALRSGQRVAQAVTPAASTADTPPVAPADSAPAPTGAATPPAPAEPPTPPPPAAPSDDGNNEVIHVTDTSVAHERFTGRTPTTVIGRAELTAAGHATLGDILQAIPSQANAGNAQSNRGGDGTTRINLRGLGAPRTLVLLNGRRLGNSGAGADSAVDINEIPLAVIERIEVYKDGASAVYGAEAIGGVVNIITRPQYQGVDVSVLTSTSQHGDGTEYDISAVTGLTTRDKNTYLVVSGGLQHHEPVLGGDRDFSRYQNTYDYATKTAGRYLSTTTPDGRLDVTGTGVQLPGCTTGICKPRGDGSWANVGPGDVYNEAAGNYIYTPSSRYNVFISGGNRMNDNLVAFGEILWLWRNSSREFSSVPFDADSAISKDSLYNPYGIDLTNLHRRFTELGPRKYDDTVSMIRFVTGVKGTPPEAWGLKDWHYELSYNYSSADVRTDNAGELNLSHLSDALGPSMIDSTGTPICVKVPGDPSTKIQYVVPQQPPLVIPCVPVNILQPAGKISAAQLKNLSYDDLAHGTNVLSTVIATARGQIAELPHHGVITTSFGADYRREQGSQDPPSAASIPGYATGTEAHATDSHFHVWEGFAELGIVPIADGEIAKRVEIDLSARALSYTRFGSDLTYKASGLFRTVGGLTARGTYATAFRAPSLMELTGGGTPEQPRGRIEVLVTAEDPCDTGPPSVGTGTHTPNASTKTQCAAQGVPTDARFGSAVLSAFTGGNQGLKPETAQTATVGVVFEPPQVPGLALSADYWHIAIDHAIESLNVYSVFANCYDRGIQSFCNQIHRDPVTHRILSVDEILQNVDQTLTSGLDLAVMYETRLPGELGNLHAALEGQYLFNYDLTAGAQVIHGVGNYDLGVYPHYKANLSARWAQNGGASAGFSLRYLGSYRECAGNDCNLEQNLATAHTIDRYFKLDLNGGYDLRSIAGLTQIQVGVNNVLNATPPTVYNAEYANSDPTAYDFVGRMVYVRLSQLF